MIMDHADRHMGPATQPLAQKGVDTQAREAYTCIRKRLHRNPRHLINKVIHLLDRCKAQGYNTFTRVLRHL